MKKNLEKAKKIFLSLVSLGALIIISWILIFGKAKAGEWLKPLINRIPQNESGLTSATDKVLGEAVKVINKENIKTVTEKSSEFFETSQYAQPARDIRENTVVRVNEVIESIKNLPAQELRLIRQQVCKQWMEEELTATSSSN